MDTRQRPPGQRGKSLHTKRLYSGQGGATSAGLESVPPPIPDSTHHGTAGARVVGAEAQRDDHQHVVERHHSARRRRVDHACARAAL